MQQVAPKIRPAAVEMPLCGIISSVRIRAQLDLMDKDGTIIDIRTAQGAPARVDHMQRFEWTTCSRLAEGSSGLVRADILVRQHAAAHHSDMGSQCRRCPMDRCLVPAGAGGHACRGYYMPNRN